MAVKASSRSGPMGSTSHLANFDAWAPHVTEGLRREIVQSAIRPRSLCSKRSTLISLRSKIAGITAIFAVSLALTP